MSMTLLGYQAGATRDVVSRINSGAQIFNQDSERTAVALTAPTGSGKTIIAAAVIETLLFGGDGLAANDRLVALWVSDSPALNEQTRDKFMKYSSRFTLDRLVMVGDDDPLDVPSLEPGKVYFLNTHKLGTGASTYRKGDGREFDLWDTIDGTGRISGTDFLMVVDEAHRGTGKPAAQTPTILGRLVKGGDGLTYPAPVVLGISATPRRFTDLIGDSMARRNVPVDVEQVRESGLVKDKVLIAHPTETQAADATLLTQAAHKRQDLARAWREFAEAEGQSPVEPILLVQVPAGESDRNIGAILDTLFEADTSLRDSHVVHALESHASTEFGSHDVRWLEPSRIQETAGVRVVVFKEALTTGWDCPRAEVLISLRGASDDTYITQLIGRTVRTPLAQRVETMDALNEVWVYLPHFDEETVKLVVNRLGSGDDAIAPSVVVNPVLLEDNPGVPDAVWEAFADFPTNTKPAKTARNDVARAVSLGMELSGLGVKGVGKAAVQRTVVDTLTSFMSREDVSTFVAERVKDFETIDFATLAVDWMSGQVVERVEGSMHVSAGNVVDLFNAAKRKMPEASAQWLWDHLCDTQFPSDPDTARLHVAAVSFHPDVVKTVESAAKALFNSWYRNNGAALLADPEARARATELLAQSKASEPTTISRPDKASTAKAGPNDWWPKHLLAAKPGQVDDPETGKEYPAGEYPWKPSNTWEERVLHAEIDRPGVVAWYRNPTSGAQTIGVPYGPDDAQRMTYPDFVIFREETGGKIAVDIVDPHRPDLGDTIPKWDAVGRWAAKVNAGDFDVPATDTSPAFEHRLGRVWAVIEDTGGDLLYVDLLVEGVRAEFARLARDGGGQPEIRALFGTYGATLSAPS